MSELETGLARSPQSAPNGAPSLRNLSWEIRESSSRPSSAALSSQTNALLEFWRRILHPYPPVTQNSGKMSETTTAGRRRTPCAYRGQRQTESSDTSAKRLGCEILPSQCPGHERPSSVLFSLHMASLFVFVVPKLRPRVLVSRHVGAWEFGMRSKARSEEVPSSSSQQATSREPAIA